jgi:diacylglycerol kinase (ATP)
MIKFKHSIGYAVSGMFYAWRIERNLKIESVITLATIFLGVYIGLTPERWCLVIFAIALVISAELFNSAIERLGNKAAAGARDPLVKAAKDIAAGAVLTTSIAALAIGIIILIIPLTSKILS